MCSCGPAAKGIKSSFQSVLILSSCKVYNTSVESSTLWFIGRDSTSKASEFLHLVEFQWIITIFTKGSLGYLSSMYFSTGGSWPFPGNWRLEVRNLHRAPPLTLRILPGPDWKNSRCIWCYAFCLWLASWNFHIFWSVCFRVGPGSPFQSSIASTKLIPWAALFCVANFWL